MPEAFYVNFQQSNACPMKLKQSHVRNVPSDMCAQSNQNLHCAPLDSQGRKIHAETKIVQTVRMRMLM